MATKNISITEEAYRRLASLRKGNESFSEIITRTVKKNDWRDYFGVLSKEAGDALEESIRKRREIHNKERVERIKRISKELNS